MAVTGKAASFSRPVQTFSLGRVSSSMFLGQESAIAESLGTFEKILTDATFFQSCAGAKRALFIAGLQIVSDPDRQQHQSPGRRVSL